MNVYIDITLMLAKRTQHLVRCSGAGAASVVHKYNMLNDFVP